MATTSAQTDSGLFDPIRIGQLQLSGRFAKSATVETRCTVDGYVTNELIDFYEEIARGGTPLIISGAASYNSYSRGVAHQISVDHDDNIEGLKKLADAVHRHGSRMFIQIYHTSRQAIPAGVGRTEAQAPSKVWEPTLGVMPRPMTLTEIEQTIEDFAAAAERCQKAGFDGIQIHAAHGYLISAFLTPHTNRRKDKYGGNLSNRMRLLLETYRAVRRRVGPDFPVIMKLNGSDELPFRRGMSTSELVTVAKMMEEEGLDAVEISAGHYESGTTFSRARWKGFTKTMATEGAGKNMSFLRRNAMRIFAPLVDTFFNFLGGYQEGFNLNYASEFTKKLNIPVICVGGFVHKSAMEKALLDGDCDMISVARGLIADPHLYKHMKEDRQGPVCLHCNACLAVAGVRPATCTNPKLIAPSG
ncbi:NADH oxidase [Pseudovibrio japonicus]|uniref:NADH oxidase n=1 Tax=Pseudovibrio japonicus TaxID=366534 RepID=A0ABQ3ERW6_9HYPH|nr:NADH:flavin oxidoreductase [Pseudovibrio japonicus]GHB49926.1 NADH oxidase [Pseudovibrio japonicus]